MTRGDSSNRIEIVFEADRCLRSRSRWASCTLCVDSCPSFALELSGKRESLPAMDPSRCLHCGQCLSACPLEAFRSSQFTERQLVARMPDKGAVRLRCFLPYGQLDGLDALDSTYQLGVCLAALSPGVLFEMAFDRPVTLSTERCSTCAVFSRARNTFQCNVQTAKSLLGNWHRERNLQESVPLVLDGPIGAAADGADGRDGAGDVEGEGAPCDAANGTHARRMSMKMRSLFHGARKNTDAPSTVFKMREQAKRVPQWRGRLRSLWQSGTLGEAPKHDVAWPTLTVDADRCHACGICRQLCPTGAIFHAFDGHRFGYGFEAGICVDCGLCIASCQFGALSREYHVSGEPFSGRELFHAEAVPCSCCGMPVLKSRAASGSDGAALCWMCVARSGKKLVSGRVRAQMSAFFSGRRGRAGGIDARTWKV